MSVPIYLSNRPFNPSIHPPLQLSFIHTSTQIIHLCIIFQVGQIEIQMREAMSHVTFIPVGLKNNTQANSWLCCTL